MDRIDRPDRERPNRLTEQPQPIDYPAGVCGSCYWRRERMQFMRMCSLCVCMPKQVIAIAQSQGAQIAFVNPVIDNLADETCAMWKPLQEDTQ